jgi:hypothetical protein
MAELQVSTLRSDLFDADRDRKLLSAETSTCRFSSLGRLCDDAVDVGTAVECCGHRRGRVVRLYLSEEKREDGDVRWWDFKPCTESLRAVPALDGWSVRIFND